MSFFFKDLTAETSSAEYSMCTKSTFQKSHCTSVFDKYLNNFLQKTTDFTSTQSRGELNLNYDYFYTNYKFYTQDFFLLSVGAFEDLLNICASI